MQAKSEWTGTVTQLYQELITTAYDSRIDTFGKMWPKSASILSRRINEVKTILRSKGIIIESYLADTTTGLRGIKICKCSQSRQCRQKIKFRNEILMIFLMAL